MINSTSIKVRFISEHDNVEEIRLSYRNSGGKKYIDLQNRTYAIIDIDNFQNITVLNKLSPVESFFSIGGCPELGNFNARPGAYYEIRWHRKTILLGLDVKEVSPF